MGGGGADGAGVGGAGTIDGVDASAAIEYSCCFCRWSKVLARSNTLARKRLAEPLLLAARSPASQRRTYCRCPCSPKPPAQVCGPLSHAASRAVEAPPGRLRDP
eukprot:2903715-Pyramimonas_sp.AAC.1